MTAPERVFILPCHPCNGPLDYYVWDRGTEYRRADLPPTLEQALAVPEIKALVEAVNAAIEEDESRYSLGDEWHNNAEAALRAIGGDGE